MVSEFFPLVLVLRELFKRYRRVGSLLGLLNDGGGMGTFSSPVFCSQVVVEVSDSETEDWLDRAYME